MNYRTVISFGEKNIDFLMKKYESFLELPLVMGRKNAHMNGVMFGYSQFIRYGFIAFIFYIGAKFINEHPEDNAEYVFTAIYILFVAAIGSGSAMTSAPSVKPA